MADSAYKISNTTVSTYKGQSASLERNKEFNTLVAQGCVRNKHCIGITKGRWASLQSLRLRLDKPEDMGGILRWIHATCILNNMLAALGDQWDDDFADDYANDMYKGADNLFLEMANVIGDDKLGHQRRELVRDYVVAFNNAYL